MQFHDNFGQCLWFNLKLIYGQSERFEIRICSASTCTFHYSGSEWLSIKSPEYIEMENENEKLNEALGALRGEISYIKTALGDKLK